MYHNVCEYVIIAINVTMITTNVVVVIVITVIDLYTKPYHRSLTNILIKQKNLFLSSVCLSITLKCFYNCVFS